ncbi:hypothetical protein BVtw_15790 [Bartonella vinsonii subsp. berkhoffii str. Tweed]|uniref:Uncharacterized protein n=1 Tax=Bartonella vinsonii subsp. berkhoffii str. Tweed TaxID=1094502 RepID=N6VPE5_BARVB|nr:hypothetical protein BVwin_13050 [Bartonella vinsonii subsp. berkhoffii str. Winnie]ENN92932.1 hypothetical protein BVtw_15790 [Bartonella vinsonii subsp. berkhoffii str. Tweed]
MDEMSAFAFAMMKLTFLLAFWGVIFDVFLTIAVVVLYYSFIKCWITSYKVSEQLRKAMKKRA